MSGAHCLKTHRPTTAPSLGVGLLNVCVLGVIPTFAEMTECVGPVEPKAIQVWSGLSLALRGRYLAAGYGRTGWIIGRVQAGTHGVAFELLRPQKRCNLR
jgi:hypothetical protein